MKFFAATLSLSLALFAPADAATGCRAFTSSELPNNIGAAFDGDCQKCLTRTWYPCNNDPALCTPECFGATASPVPAPSPSPTNAPKDKRCKKVKRLLKKTAFWEIISGNDGKIDVGNLVDVGSKLFINGDVYSDTDFSKPSGTYNQMCTLANTDGDSIQNIQNFCEYNFCLDINEDNKGCIMLRSGGPYGPFAPPVSIPDIDAFVYGGTGCFKGIQGSAMIEAIAASSCEVDCPTPDPIRDTFLKLVLEHVVPSNSMMVRRRLTEP
jgi:hypothetical protein